jgi:hypothetical protein
MFLLGVVGWGCYSYVAIAAAAAAAAAHVTDGPCLAWPGLALLANACLWDREGRGEKEGGISADRMAIYEFVTITME